MYNDILEAVRGTKNFVRDQITEYAEQHAELYVSSTMGLEDGHPDKQKTKDTYIEEFRNLMFQQLY